VKDKIELTEEMVNTLENPPKANNAFKAAAKKYKGECIETEDELCKWLRDNSSGIYRQSANVADKIEGLAQQVAELDSYATLMKRDNISLHKQVAELRAALQSVKLHQEKITPSGFEFSSVWQVANKALEEKQ